MPMLEHWMVWALLSALFAALTAVLAKIGIKGVDPDLAMALRTLVVAALIVPFVWLTGKWANPLALPGKTLGFLALSALATGASWLCYFRALQAGEVFQVAPVDKMSVVLAAVLAFFLLGERPSLREWLGIGLIGAGVAVMVIRKG